MCDLSAQWRLISGSFIIITQDCYSCQGRKEGQKIEKNRFNVQESEKPCQLHDLKHVTDRLDWTNVY